MNIARVKLNLLDKKQTISAVFAASACPLFRNDKMIVIV
jgi:hypothetical protein